MYPITCLAGFPNPIARSGKCEIVGYSVVPDAVGTATEVAIIDDVTIKDSDNFGKFIGVGDIPNSKTIIAWDRVSAGFNGGSIAFPEPIKIRRGISVGMSNVKAGGFILYIK